MHELLINEIDRSRPAASRPMARAMAPAAASRSGRRVGQRTRVPDVVHAQAGQLTPIEILSVCEGGKGLGGGGGGGLRLVSSGGQQRRSDKEQPASEPSACRG